ncbi:MAG TPA: hypothetical protein VK400_20775 [Pyrinomonadaceae bacterium]|nr:hypothetical protein [Pyrinomonadaceae bacterium]
MSAIKQTERAPRAASAVSSPTIATTTRQLRIGKWVESLKTSDVNQLWSELHRVVCSHPLVRASKSAGLLVEEGKYNAYTDLTQELFVALLSKERFQHYLDSGMTNAEVEAEISQIELTNLLTAELRKRYPESYRLARRISTLIQTSSTFKRFDNINNADIHRRLADRTYGLAEWADKKSRRNHQEAEQRVQTVAFHKRDTRMVGCTGDAQIVISNTDLEKLIVRVLKAIDSPIDVRSLRSLVMSRLPVMDIYLVPIGGGDDSDEENKFQLDPADTRENPEQNLLRQEGENIAAGYVENFLKNLNKSVRGKAKQYNRMISVLWHCYLSSDSGTQLEVAAMLGVSDSLVSDYRRRIENNLQQLSFSGVGEARQFEQALRHKVRHIISEEEKITV